MVRGGEGRGVARLPIGGGVEEPVHVYPDTGIFLAETIRRRADEEKVRHLLSRQLRQAAFAQRSRGAKAADRLKTQASEHFDRLADEISRAAAERREPGGTAHATRLRQAGTAVDGDIPLGVYNAIAGLHEQLGDERIARCAAEEELRNELLLQRSRYAARGESLEARAGDLEAQLRNVKAQNENLSDNLRDMEESTTWRLFGPYRRLRTKIRALTKSTPEDAKESSATRSDCKAADLAGRRACPDADRYLKTPAIPVEGAMGLALEDASACGADRAMISGGWMLARPFGDRMEGGSG